VHRELEEELLLLRETGKRIATSVARIRLPSIPAKKPARAPLPIPPPAIKPAISPAMKSPISGKGPLNTACRIKPTITPSKKLPFVVVITLLKHR